MTLLIFDLSSYEDSPANPARVDFNKAKSSGIVAAYFRAANGLLTDSAFSQFVTDCSEVMPWGSYGVIYPNLSAKLQAQNYIRLIQKYGMGQLPLCVDWEVESVTWQMVDEYTALLEQTFPNKEICIYSRNEYLRRMLPNAIRYPAKYYRFSKLPIWQAQYSSKPDALPFGFTRMLWQYSDRGDASLYGITEAKGVDLNYYDGTIEQFNVRFGLSVTPPVVVIPPVVVDPPPIVVVPPVVIPPVVTPPASIAGYYRILHDNEHPLSERLPRAKGWVKGKKLRGLPETYRYQGGRGNLVLAPWWVDYLKKINSPDAIRYLSKPDSGWLNTGGKWQVEYLTFGGNFVYVSRIEGNKAFINTYNNADVPPIGMGPNILVQKFGVVYNDGHHASGTDTKVGMAYTLLITRPEDHGKVWIDVNNLVKL
jgi:GH25 family lysozyme M1 (1,4-beta-N-acetylmuramidase)